MILLKRSLALAAVAFCGLLNAQAPGAAKADSPEVKALIEKAKKAGGSMWAYEEHFLCEDPRGNRADEPVIAPTKLFDNVYVFGNEGTVAYVIQTSAGLVMIDSLAANQVETQLLPGFQKLGLNPGDVKMILLGHGHADHFGGAPYMQEHYGSKVYLSTQDWDLIEHPAARADGKKVAPVVAPKHDGEVKEGVPVVFGGLTITPVAIPGHTPGSMGYIFPVKDRGKTHMAGIYGGTVLLPGIVSDQGLKTYVDSVRHFREAAKKAKVDVVMQNHPLMYPLPAMLDKLASRKAGEPNPFVVGAANYQKFLDVLDACSEANVARRKP